MHAISGNICVNVKQGSCWWDPTNVALRTRGGLLGFIDPSWNYPPSLTEIWFHRALLTHDALLVRFAVAAKGRCCWILGACTVITRTLCRRQVQEVHRHGWNHREDRGEDSQCVCWRQG